MGFFDSTVGKVTAGLLLVLVLVGAVSGSRYFIASNEMTDEVSVVRNSKNLLKLQYVPGEELGDENKEIEAGEWSEFGLRLSNDNTQNDSAWENVNIRCKFFNISKENISLLYRQGEDWENSRVYDLKLLELGGQGAGVDIGPENGWRVDSNSFKDIRIRVKVEELIDNLKVRFQAITSEKQNYEIVDRFESPKSKNILYPIGDTYISEKNPLQNFSEEDHLELSTGENKNSYILLSFNTENLPSPMNSASLNLYQYWGSGFSSLKNSNVSLQAYYLNENPNIGDISWKNADFELGNIIAEKEILGNDKWYNLDISEFLKSENRNDVMTFLLRFSQDNFDENERRIRFASKEGENIPSIITIEEQ